MTAFEAVQCPRCESPLQKRKAPFYLHGDLIGSFESLVCDMCHFSALTSRGYQDATAEAEKFGLIGPAETIIRKVAVAAESFSTIDNEFVISGLLSIANDTQQVLLRPGEKLKSEAIASPVELAQEIYAKSRRASHMTYEIPTSKN